MLTPADFKAIISANFDDNRIFAIQSFVSNLIERKRFSDGINQFRIKDTNDGTFVTSLANFVSKIDDTKLSVGYHLFTDVMLGDRVHPMVASIGNLEVELNKHSAEDEIYFTMFGENVKKIMFIISYISDGDTVLPLKIIEIKLIS
jgi:hypothetical protein